MALLRLAPQVHKLYQERQTVPISEQYIFKKTVEDTLELPTPALENWIFKANIRIKQSKSRLTTKHQLNRPLHPFFTKICKSIQSKKIIKNKAAPKTDKGEHHSQNCNHNHKIISKSIILNDSNT
jgi:hypothetical protein